VFKHLLVPLDGSRLAESVLPKAVYFAGLFAARLQLIHIIEAAAPAAVHGDRHLTGEAEARAYLDAIVQRLARPDLRIDCEVHAAKEEDVAHSIIEHSVELGIDLVLLCAHGHGGLREMFVGSIAQQVIQRGTTPVLLVRPTEGDADATYACKSILTPLDGSDLHEPALPVAAAVARAAGAALHLLTVVPTAATLSPERAATGVLLPSTMTAILDLVQRDAISYLQKKTASLVADGVKASAEVMRGDAATCIIEEIGNFQADLVVSATHGETTASAFWSGGVTPKILVHSPAPVLLVRVIGDEALR
jgi:nucleotide-binding universal stress UspA family protein